MPPPPFIGNGLNMMKVDLKKDTLGLALILINTVLLGIWSVKDTIALRNFLLGIGSLLSIFFIVNQIKDGVLSLKVSAVRFIPLLLVFLMFGWVVFHYFFLSRYPQVQLHELQSNWFRSFLGAIVGVGMALALLKHPRASLLIWLGVIASFVVLFFQYLPQAYLTHSMYAINWYGGYYIYIGKINAVLMGTLLIAGLGGAILDQIRLGKVGRAYWGLTWCIFALILILFDYVFVLDTRNGIGLAVLIMFIWLLLGIKFLLQSGTLKTSKHIRLIGIGFVFLLAFVVLTIQQIRHNSGWSSLLEDAKIAVQVDKYPHWQNYRKWGYPQNALGREVNNSNYERVAWATVGVGLIARHPLGIGVGDGSFAKLLEQEGYINPPHSTHSAWVELGMTYGVPGLILLLGSLFGILSFVLFAPKSQNQVFILSLGFGISILYAVGELNTQHGCEVLMYFLALLSTLLPFLRANSNNLPNN